MRRQARMAGLRQRVIFADFDSARGQSILYALIQEAISGWGGGRSLSNLFWRYLGFDQLFANRVADQFGPVVDIELAHQIAFVRVHGFHAEIQLGGYIFERSALG